MISFPGNAAFRFDWTMRIIPLAYVAAGLIILLSCHSPVKPAVKALQPPAVTKAAEKPVIDTAGDYFQEQHHQKLFRQLSRQFDIDFRLDRRLDTAEGRRLTTVQLLLKDKATGGLLDSLQIPIMPWGIFWKDSSDVRSYATGYRQHAEHDQNFGYLVVADLNFDGRDDIAVSTDCGADNGPFYTFVLQQPGRRFAIDRYLTDTMQIFPFEIDRRRHMVSTDWAAGVAAAVERFHYDTATRKWKMIEHYRWGPHGKEKMELR